MFCGTAAAALESVRVFEHEQQNRERLRNLFEATNVLTGSIEQSVSPPEFLERILQATVLNTGARAVAILLSDDSERPLTTSTLASAAATLLPILGPVCKEVVVTGRPAVFENTGRTPIGLGLSKVDAAVQSAIALPLTLFGSVSGVLWIIYASRRRLGVEVRALLSYATQVASVYGGVLRMHGMAAFQLASASISVATDLSTVYDKIVSECGRLFRADLCVLIPYDYASSEFVDQPYTSPKDYTQSIKAPKPGGVSSRALLGDYVIVTAANSAFLRDNGFHFAQAVRLFVGNDTLAILYLNYRGERQQTVEDVRRLQNLASLAAVTIQKARYLQELRTVQEAAKVVAEVTAHGDVHTTLQDVAAHIRGALHCDAVSIISYGSSRDTCKLPPAVSTREGIGTGAVLDRESAMRILDTISELAGPVILNRNDNDRALGWVLDIRMTTADPLSRVAVPLVAGKSRAGAMLLDYSSYHHKDYSASEEVKLFVYQATVAIRNAQLFEELTSRLRLHSGVFRLSENLLRPWHPQIILDETARAAKSELGTDFANIVLRRPDGRLCAVAQEGWPSSLLRIDLEDESHAGYAVRERKSVHVKKFADQGRFRPPERLYEAGITSGIAVPVSRDNDVLGAILVHSKDFRSFSKAEEDYLSLIATECIIPYERAEAAQKSREWLAKVAHELPQVLPEIWLTADLDRRSVVS